MYNEAYTPCLGVGICLLLTLVLTLEDKQIGHLLG